jgi:hypothetical protein
LGIRLIENGDPDENIVRALEAPSLDNVTDPVGRTLREFSDQTGSDRRALVERFQGSNLITRPS